MEPVKAFCGVSEVQEILNMGRTEIYDLIRAGVIPIVEIDGDKRGPEEPFQAWMKSLITSSTSF